MEKIEVENIIDVDSLKPNSIVVFKLKAIDENHVAILKAFRDRYIELLKSKNITCLILSGEENISTMSEETMNSIGWFRKDAESEKPLIIT